MHCIAQLVLKMFRSLIGVLISLDVCWTISRNAVPFDVTLYHFTRAVYVILGCTVWMYAKLFHAKLCYLILRCITSPNTVPSHPGLTHSTSRWTVSLDSVPFHAQLFHLTLDQLLLCYAISCNAIPFEITLAQLKLCCATWTEIASLFVLWHDQIILCCTI